MEPHEVLGTARHRRAPRQGLGVVNRSNKVGHAPGVESIEVIDDTHFKATAKVGSAHQRPVRREPELAEQEARIARGSRPWPAPARGRGRDDGLSARPIGRDPDGLVRRRRVAGSWRRSAHGHRGNGHKMIGQTFDCMKTTLEA